MSNDKSKTILQKYTPFVKFLLFNKQCKTYKIERFFSKKSEKKGDPKKWTLDENKVPDAQDFANVSDKYINWKRWIQTFFPGKEYAEAYGSEYEK